MLLEPKTTLPTDNDTVLVQLLILAALLCKLMGLEGAFRYHRSAINTDDAHV